MVNAIETINENKKEVLIPALAWEFDEKIVRTIQLNGEPWWILNDMCKVLELTNSRMVLERLDKEDVSQVYVLDSNGHNQQTNIINEPGLYSLILRSDKPEAKAFKKWITSVVLPQIRKTGFYISGNEYQNISKKLIELEKQVQLIKQSSATFNNELCGSIPCRQTAIAAQ